MTTARGGGVTALALAGTVVRELTRRRATVATAESLTGGLVAAGLTDVAGASAVVRGGLVAYATDVKAGLLGVDPALLDRAGAVDAGVAEQMACGARERFGSTYGLATTGVAGPDRSEGKPVGTVFVAVAGPEATRVRALDLRGDRDAIRRASVQAVLGLLAEALDLSADEPEPPAAQAAGLVPQAEAPGPGGGEQAGAGAGPSGAVDPIGSARSAGMEEPGNGAR